MDVKPVKPSYSEHFEIEVIWSHFQSLNVVQCQIKRQPGGSNLLLSFPLLLRHTHESHPYSIQGPLSLQGTNVKRINMNRNANEVQVQAEDLAKGTRQRCITVIAISTGSDNASTDME